MFKTGTNIIEYGPNTKVWELHEEALHHAVGGGLGKDEIASLTKELRRHFKATKGQGPRMAAEEIYVKMRLLERSDLDDATRTLLTRQIQTLRNRGMKDGY